MGYMIWRRSGNITGAGSETNGQDGQEYKTTPMIWMHCGISAGIISGCIYMEMAKSAKGSINVSRIKDMRYLVFLSQKKTAGKNTQRMCMRFRQWNLTKVVELYWE